MPPVKEPLCPLGAGKTTSLEIRLPHQQFFAGCQPNPDRRRGSIGQCDRHPRRAGYAQPYRWPAHGKRREDEIAEQADEKGHRNDAEQYEGSNLKDERQAHFARPQHKLRAPRPFCRGTLLDDLIAQALRDGRYPRLRPSWRKLILPICRVSLQFYLAYCIPPDLIHRFHSARFDASIAGRMLQGAMTCLIVSLSRGPDEPPTLEGLEIARRVATLPSRL